MEGEQQYGHDKTLHLRIALENSESGLVCALGLYHQAGRISKVSNHMASGHLFVTC